LANHPCPRSRQRCHARRHGAVGPLHEHRLGWRWLGLLLLPLSRAREGSDCGRAHRGTCCVLPCAGHVAARGSPGPSTPDQPHLVHVASVTEDGRYAAIYSSPGSGGHHCPTAATASATCRSVRPRNWPGSSKAAYLPWPTSVAAASTGSLAARCGSASSAIRRTRPPFAPAWLLAVPQRPCGLDLSRHPGDDRGCGRPRRARAQLQVRRRTPGR
jgi:hypothetical protein